MPSGGAGDCGRFPALSCPTRRRFLLQPDSCDPPWGFFRVRPRRADLVRGVARSPVDRNNPPNTPIGEFGHQPLPHEPRNTESRTSGGWAGAMAPRRPTPAFPRKTASRGCGVRSAIDHPDAVPPSGCAHRPESPARCSRWKHHLARSSDVALTGPAERAAARASGPTDAVLIGVHSALHHHLGRVPGRYSPRVRRSAFRWRGKTDDLVIQLCTHPHRHDGQA